MKGKIDQTGMEEKPHRKLYSQCGDCHSNSLTDDIGSFRRTGVRYITGAVWGKNTLLAAVELFVDMVYIFLLVLCLHLLL